MRVTFPVLVPLALLLFLGSAHSQSIHEPASAAPNGVMEHVEQERHDARIADMRDAPIRSLAALSKYLSEHPSSPFDAFSGRALGLFVESLTFNERGLTGFRTAEVESELTPSEAHAILSLFGVQKTISSLQFETETNEARERLQRATADDILTDHVDRIRTLDRDIDSPSLKLRRMKDIFVNVLGQVDRAEIEDLSDLDVKEFFEVSMLLAAYSNEPTYASQMRRAFNELERRELSTRRQAQRMRDQYVATRMIADAADFASERSNLNLKKIPRFVETASPQRQPKLWQLSADGSMLESHDFRIDPDAAVIVVASPWCSFSHAASIAIANDRELSQLMAQHSIWILSQISVPDFDDIKEWNETFPGRPLQMVDRNIEWSDINLSETPIFYFYRQGEVVSTVNGWPGPEQLEKLRAGFSGLGLTASSPGDTER